MSELTPQSQATVTTAEANVLLVEDNIVNQRVATRMLERLGCRVTVTADGQEALQATAGVDYDLVFMDCQMPVMDGYEATRAIRQRETGTGQHLPIIALTANAMPGDREKCLTAGMDDYVSKPVDPTSLLDLVQKWLPPTSKSTEETANPNEVLSAVAATESAVIDRAAFDELLALCDVDETPEILCDILEAFLQDTQEQLTALRQAATAADAAKLELTAHTLKSSSSNVAALRMAKLCIALQTMGRAGIVTGAMSQVEQLENEFSRVQDIFVKECARRRDHFSAR